MKVNKKQNFLPKKNRKIFTGKKTVQFSSEKNRKISFRKKTAKFPSEKRTVKFSSENK